MTATIDCTGGWHSEQVWRGVPLARLLDEAELLPEARSVKVTSATGYYRRFTIAEARDYLLATHVGGRLLPRGHGYPVRLAARGKARLRVGQVGDRHRDRQPPQSGYSRRYRFSSEVARGFTAEGAEIAERTIRFLPVLLRCSV